MERIQLVYHEEARRSGVYVIGGCGAPSILNDLGVDFVRNTFKGIVKLSRLTKTKCIGFVVCNELPNMLIWYLFFQYFNIYFISWYLTCQRNDNMTMELCAVLVLVAEKVFENPITLYGIKLFFYLRSMAFDCIFTLISSIKIISNGAKHHWITDPERNLLNKKKKKEKEKKEKRNVIYILPKSFKHCEEYMYICDVSFLSFFLFFFLISIFRRNNVRRPMVVTSAHSNDFFLLLK